MDKDKVVAERDDEKLPPLTLTEQVVMWAVLAFLFFGAIALTSDIGKGIGNFLNATLPS